MNCPSCGSSLPDGAAVCASCSYVMGTSPPGVATGALTPPDGLVAPHLPTMDQTDQLGQRLQHALGDGYQVEQALGSGGFAVVYQVRDLSLKRKLAVKVLSPDVIASKTAMERFRREAETVAQLSHPHIVPLHFIGQKEDLLYLAMECVEGQTLGDKVEREKMLSIEDTVRLTREVASALEHAHKKGVIHRDIKPGNVLLDHDTGRALVTDFGIARTAEASSLTASGMVVGTPAYLSPEQITGGHADARSDIYALGIMVYEMLAGRPPFEGPTPTAVLMKRLAEKPPPIEKLRPDVPPVLRDVIEGCLAQEPSDRFASAGEIVRALGGATPSSGGHSTIEIVTRVRRARRRWSIIVGSGAGVAALVIGFAFWKLWSERAPALPAFTMPEGMVAVPAGTYLVGRDDSQLLARPAHQVVLDSFAIGATEVTVADYKGFIGATRAPAPWQSEPPDAQLPVTGLNWGEASAFCSWKYPNGRLPSEEEWEAAARGAEGRRYPWGNTADTGTANTASRRTNGPRPVRSFPRGATPSGLFDMVGNVWEWTSSPMEAYPGGTAPADGAQYRVIRGGAFNSPDSSATASWRGYLLPSASQRTWYAGTGFRCLVPLTQDRG